jgi:hypothetical protein
MSPYYNKTAHTGLFCSGGEGEIRTHGCIAATTDFKSVALDHSATSPCLVFGDDRIADFTE